MPSGMAALLVATAPFWMAILETLRKDGERISVRGGIGMLTGFIGVAMDARFHGERAGNTQSLLLATREACARLVQIVFYFVPKSSHAE